MRNRFLAELKFVLIIYAIFVCIQFINSITAGSLQSFALVPRSIHGTLGIVGMHFLHGGFKHLALNAIPFIVFSMIILLEDRKIWWKVSIASAFLAGGLLWLFGRTAAHMGSSLLIFAYFAFILGAGFYQRSYIKFFIALFVLFFYRKMLTGILPGENGVSWEGHLFGFISGFFLAKQLSNQRDNFANSD